MSIHFTLRVLGIVCLVIAARVVGAPLWRGVTTWWKRRRLRQRVTREFKAELDKAFADAFQFSTPLKTGAEPGAEPALTPAAFSRVVRDMLEAYEQQENIQPLEAQVEGHYDPETNRMHTSIPTTWDVIANLAWGRYDDGQTHEQVTAWLDGDIKQGWREWFAEVVLGDGSKRWALRGSIIEDSITP